MQNNIEFIVRNNLCTGCGTCAGVCPSYSIIMREFNGLNLPKVDKKLCSITHGCKVCALVCPGMGMDLNEYGKELFPSHAYNDFYLGRFLECYTGCSTDYNIRFHSASGGMVTQMLIFMIEKKIINGAIVTKMNSKDPLRPEVIIAKTREEIISARSSKYCPVSLNTAIKNVLSENIKVAVVGLPCHIHGFRKAEKIFTDLKDKVIAYLGLFCSSTRTYNATEFLAKEYKINKEDVCSFAYRDEGWLGSMLVKLKTNEIKKIPYRKYYREIRSFFIPFRCTLCPDHAAELSDISFGDIYISEFWNDKIGTNSIIARSERGHKLLKEAYNAKAIELKKIDPCTIIKSQYNTLIRKKKQIRIRFAFLRFFGKKTTNILQGQFSMGNSMERFKHLVTAVILYLQIRIGKCKQTWFLIRYLNSLTGVSTRKS